MGLVASDEVLVVASLALDWQEFSALAQKQVNPPALLRPWRMETTNHSLPVSPDAVLQQKIVKLLSPRYRHETERWFVALVLTTRLTFPADEKPRTTPLSRVLEEQSPRLEAFCQALLDASGCAGAATRRERPRKTLGFPEDDSACLGARLVAQFLSTCGRMKYHVPYDALVGALVRRWPSSLDSTTGDPQTRRPSALDLEILAALDACLPMCRDPALVDQVLLCVWQGQVEFLQGAVTSHPPSDLTAHPAGPAPDSPKPPTAEGPAATPSSTLEATLSAILDQSGPPIGGGREGRFEWWEWHAAALLAEHMPRSAGRPPAALVRLLDWWLTRREYPGPKPSPPWTLALLRGLRDCRRSLPLPQDPVLAGKVRTALLACAANTRPDDALRDGAWSAALALVDAHGWEWTLAWGPEPKESSPMGRASHLCALLRLASGECKIRWGRRLHEHDPPVPPPSSHLPSSQQQKHEDDGDAVVDHCGMLLAQALEFVSQLADGAASDHSPCDVVASLPAEAIGHIRQTFRETLQTCAQYCALVSAETFGPQDETAIRLLGALWTEFDIFDEAADFGGGGDEDGDPTSLWTALHAVLTKTKDLDTQSSLFPALQAILVGCDEGPGRLPVLKPYLGDFVPFFESWWSSAGPTRPGNELLEGAGQVLELWHDCLVQACVTVEVGSILRHLAQFLVRATGSGSGPRTVPAVAAAVSSYVLLQGDEPPAEPEASILQQAFAFLQHHGS